MKINRDNYEIWFLDYAEGKLTPEQVDEVLIFIENHPDLKEELESFEIISLENPDKNNFPGKSTLHKPIISIDRNNYEDHFISYSEGLLNDEEKKEVEKFASESSSLLRELNNFISARLVAEETLMEEKSFFKKGYFSYSAEEKEFWMVSYLEGELTDKQSQEFALLITNNPLLAAELKQYEKAFLPADNKQVFKNKNSLKKGSKTRTISLAEYISYAAAACLLLFFLIPGSEPEVKNTALLENTERTQKENSIVTNTSDDSATSTEKIEKAEEIISPTIDQHQNEPAHNNSGQIHPYPEYETIIKADPIDPRALTCSIPVEIDQKNIMVAAYTSPDPEESLADHSSDNNFLTPRELIKKIFNKKVFGEESQTEENIAYEKKERSAQIGNLPVNISSEKQENYSAYGFSVGGFSFSRSLHK